MIRDMAGGLTAKVTSKWVHLKGWSGLLQCNVLIPKDLGLPWTCEGRGGQSADSCKSHTWMLQMLLQLLSLAGAFFARWKLSERS